MSPTTNDGLGQQTTKGWTVQHSLPPPIPKRRARRRVCTRATDMTPTQRSLARLRKEGYEADVVEKWIPQARKRKDLWGVFDIAALHPTAGFLFVQVTSTSNLSSRRRKLAESNAVAWIRDVYGSGMCELHGWAKRGPAGKRKLWTLKREVL